MNVLRMRPRAVGDEPVDHVPAESGNDYFDNSLAADYINTRGLLLRISSSKDWSKLPLTSWLILIIYADSILFIFISTILQHGFGLNINMTICPSSIVICLACYMTTKIVCNTYSSWLTRLIRSLKLIYYFLVEKFSLSAASSIFDATVNLYLTLLFFIPLRSLYSYKNSPNSSLRTIALRSFVGSLATLTSSVVNLTFLMVLKREQAWICLMLCNADILFSVIVLHWVTSKDSIEGGSTASNLTSREGLPIKRTLWRRWTEWNGVGNGDHTYLRRETDAGVEAWERSEEAMPDAGNESAKILKKGKNLKKGKILKKSKSLKNSKSGNETHLLGTIQVQVGHAVETVSIRGKSVSDNECGLIPDFRFSGSNFVHQV
ncbi:uncharacterized protein RCO7_03748 [Rhynchosporium graminicola]|uniref:Uncharacterized protein n=1 Tax=Rhynchosporium graminicola TaxID=2792576 RepID=A0A1E1LGJ3_9HELO|nr:uncharacterized protein RCO7_03748 [Rhynchosporium commune]